MTSPYADIFKASHQEQLLIPAVDIAEKIRDEAIALYCLPKFDSTHVAALDGQTSSCAIMNSTRFPGRSVIINISQVQELANHCNLEFTDCLKATLLHEWAHIKIYDVAGAEATQSESDTWVKAWEIASALTDMAPQDFQNLRGWCEWRRKPTVQNIPVDSRPAWIKTFDKLSQQIGYSLAWGAIQNDIKALGLQSWDILAALQDAGWDFDISYPLSEGEDIPHALTKLAIQRNDVAELERVARTAMPKHTSRLVPEQPPGYRIAR